MPLILELFLKIIPFPKVLDDLKKRHGPDFPTTQHVIYVANTSPYDMPVLQSSRFLLLAFQIFTCLRCLQAAAE
jgi:hypothetical protein